MEFTDPSELKRLLRECESIMTDDCDPAVIGHTNNVIPLIQSELLKCSKDEMRKYLNSVFLTMKSEYSASRVTWMFRDMDKLKKQYNAIACAFLILDTLSYLLD